MTDPNAFGRATPDQPLDSPVTNPLPGLRRVEQIMGTAIGLDVRDASIQASALDDVFAYLREVDRRFSPYKPDSEVSRMIRGELEEADAGPDLSAILSLCDQVRQTTDGYFDIRAHRPDGRPDPTGLVKGWAVEEAFTALLADLRMRGPHDALICAGGDIAVACSRTDTPS